MNAIAIWPQFFDDEVRNDPILSHILMPNSVVQTFKLHTCYVSKPKNSEIHAFSNY